MMLASELKRCNEPAALHQVILIKHINFFFFISVCTTVVYVLLMIFGLSGNILTILVVWLRPYMRSSTYLYLSSMSVSDMLILLLLPLEVYKVPAHAQNLYLSMPACC